MPRTQISIKLDEDLLARVDQLAESAGTNRTAVIEQAVKNDLPEQEAFQSSLENPAIRAIHEQITRPGMLKLLATLANAKMSDDEIAEIIDKAPRQRAAAKLRVDSRKSKRHEPKADGA